MSNLKRMSPETPANVLISSDIRWNKLHYGLKLCSTILATQKISSHFIGNVQRNWLAITWVLQKIHNTSVKYEAKLVKGSIDFIGLNHYTTASVKDRSSSIKKNTRDFGADIEADISLEAVAADQYPVIPSGLYEFPEYLKEAYGNPPIYIQENGQKTSVQGSNLDNSQMQIHNTSVQGSNHVKRLVINIVIKHIMEFKYYLGEMTTRIGIGKISAKFLLLHQAIGWFWKRFPGHVATSTIRDMPSCIC
ncbi:hydroxyisourate hydrolase [Nicotiana attenuata]|uniref:Hydroxyisourate hydrolase n=1 Tax=Nicotiana attenuata TaxID=49451 RepID=A0A314KP12_NICAT|nr:hydroxyisourate hydrolase [Nicotiana attenuata]